MKIISVNQIRVRPPTINSDRSSIQPSSLGAQIVHLAERRRAFGQDIAAPNSLVNTEISPIVSPSNSPNRKNHQESIEHDTAVEDQFTPLSLKRGIHGAFNDGLHGGGLDNIHGGLHGGSLKGIHDDIHGKHAKSKINKKSDDVDYISQKSFLLSPFNFTIN